MDRIKEILWRSWVTIKILAAWVASFFRGQK